jgi:hypothetical protein
LKERIGGKSIGKKNSSIFLIDEKENLGKGLNPRPLGSKGGF